MPASNAATVDDWFGEVDPSPRARAEGHAGQRPQDLGTAAERMSCGMPASPVTQASGG